MVVEVRGEREGEWGWRLRGGRRDGWGNGCGEVFRGGRGDEMDRLVGESRGEDEGVPLAEPSGAHR